MYNKGGDQPFMCVIFSALLVYRVNYAFIKFYSLSYMLFLAYMYMIKPPKTKLIIIEAHAYIEAMFC